MARRTENFTRRCEVSCVASFDALWCEDLVPVTSHIINPVYSPHVLLVVAPPRMSELHLQDMQSV